MKDSYIRSKVELKPLNSSDFKKKSSVLDYEQYQEQLNNFEKDKKHPQLTELFDWSKPSQVIPLQKSQKQPQPQQAVLPNNSMNTQQLLRSEQDEPERHLQHDSDLDDSMQIESPNRSLAQKPTYMEQIRSDYGNEYKLMSVIKLETELREMRERIIEMNTQLNKKLDKYELLSGQTRKEPVVMNPYKFTSKSIELNKRIIQKQLANIKKIEEKDKELEKKDYLVELNELVIEIKKQIHDIEKQKHDQHVDVQKIDKLLKQFEHVQEIGSQYKQVKDLRHLIVFYFKKLKEQKLTEEQLEKDHEQLYEKQALLSQKLDQLSMVAAENCLQVSTNRHFVEMKKRYEYLVGQVDSQRKKKQTLLKIQKGAEQKLEKEILHLKKQIQKVQKQTQETEFRSIGIDEDTKGLMSKNTVLNRELKSISYRFEDDLLRPYEKNRYKPDFRRKAMTRMQGKGNKTIDAPARDDKNMYSINDKNTISPVPQEVTQSVENAESNSSASSRMKPILRSWKGKPNNARYLQSPQKMNTIERSNIFKPSLLSKSKK